ncbi:NPC1-like intracellular cholesterol transporter 1 [Halotydeus destructor]|nr:NPC1-like intracellular cholesterol transporter 1 [Halotydeus destructor]
MLQKIVSFLFLTSLTLAFELEQFRTRRQAGDGKCLMTGVCGEGTYGHIPCYQESDHHKFENDTKAAAILKKECPQLFPPGVAFPEVCCSAEEVMKLQELTELMEEILPGCPACTNNIQEILCHLTCAPNQDQFIEVLKKVDAPSGGQAVDEINYYISRTFSQGLHDSCAKLVQKALPQEIRAIMEEGCPSGRDCVVDEVFKKAGQSEKTGGAMPFQVNYIFSDDVTITKGGKTLTPAQLGFVPCNTGVNGGQACACDVCEASCSA